MDKVLKDNINPEHYKQGKIETIEWIRLGLTDEEFEGYLKGNIYKYNQRYKNKNGIEDLNKAKWYENYLIKIIKEGDKNEKR